jgi:two-component system phosphate regulon response regulator PhoB
MEKQILVLDDSPSCQVIAKESLRHMGNVSVCSCLKEARLLAEQSPRDIIILDIFLPDGSGIELLGELRESPACKNSIFIVISGDGDVTKKIAAFSLGADDYLVKPFSPLELKARVERYLRRDEKQDIFLDTFSAIELNSTSYRAFMQGIHSKEDLNLTPHEFKILNLLLRHPDHIYSRKAIIDLVWGSNVHISDRTVDSHISGLRKKLKSVGGNIACIRGEGYKWSPEKPRMHEKF